MDDRLDPPFADEPERGFLTDQEPVGEEHPEPGGAATLLEQEPGRAVAVESVETAEAATADTPAPDAHEGDGAFDLSFLDVRPAPGVPRDYRFPRFERERLDNGLTLIRAHLPGRPLLVAQLILDSGAAVEPPELAGVTSLAARALSEGSHRRDAIEFVEAAERLGAELHAETGWETLAATVEVPRSRFGPALGLLAELALEPSFPEAEVERLRSERMNDLLQARAEPRRRVERAFTEAIYAPSSPFSRPMGGTEDTVPRLDRGAVVERHRRMSQPGSATLVVAGDLEGVPVVDSVAEWFGEWRPASPAGPPPAPAAAPHPAGRRIILVDRPGSPQTEVRIGHVGLPRRIPDFHAVAVLSSVLGGLFNSRLQRLLREERGYTYGIHAGFELRRSAGPFAVRTAVQTEVTVPAIHDVLGELERIRTSDIEQRELEEARDYLIGVFPLRFESPAQVAAAIIGLVVFDLPDDELDRYRSAIAAVGVEDVRAAARHVRPEEAAIVLVGDASALEGELRAAGLGQVDVVRDPPLSSLGMTDDVIAS